MTTLHEKAAQIADALSVSKSVLIMLLVHPAMVEVKQTVVEGVDSESAVTIEDKIRGALNEEGMLHVR